MADTNEYLDPHRDPPGAKANLGASGADQREIDVLLEDPELESLCIEGQYIDTCHYRPYRRAKNWAATVTRSKGQSPERAFLAGDKGIYRVDSLRDGDVLELAADHVYCSGRRRPDREFYLVVRVYMDDCIILKRFPTLARALQQQGRHQDWIDQALASSRVSRIN